MDDLKSMKSKCCCFTGHRKLPEGQRAEIMAKTEAEVRKLLSGGINRFLVGGAVGYDMEVAKLLFRLKNECPDIRVVLIYPFDGYSDRWNDAQKAEYAELLPQYDEAIRASERSGRDAYLLWNRLLVDGASVCIAYCHKQRSGTAYTVKYAKEWGLDVVNVVSVVAAEDKGLP